MLQREIELMFRNRGFERGSKEAVMRLAEEITDLKMVIKDIAETIDKLATVMGMLNTVADTMKDKIDRMERGDDNPLATQSLISRE